MSHSHDLDVLLACLDRLRDHNLSWTKAAIAHHNNMVAGRLIAMDRGIRPLETLLESICEEEEVRIRSTLGLALEVGLPDDPPPRLVDIAALLPEPWASDLIARGRSLRDAVKIAEDAAKRITGVAQIGLQISQGTLRLAQASAVRKMRPPAGYGRSGLRPTGTAVPVFHHAWKA
jgi:hypothetical protein